MVREFLELVIQGGGRGWNEKRGRGVGWRCF